MKKIDKIFQKEKLIMKVLMIIIITLTLYKKIETDELNFGIGITKRLETVKEFRITHIEIKLNTKTLEDQKIEIERSWRKFKRETIEAIIKMITESWIKTLTSRLGQGSLLDCYPTYQDLL